MRLTKQLYKHLWTEWTTNWTNRLQTYWLTERLFIFCFSLISCTSIYRDMFGKMYTLRRKNISLYCVLQQEACKITCGSETMAILFSFFLLHPSQRTVNTGSVIDSQSDHCTQVLSFPISDWLHSFPLWPFSDQHNPRQGNARPGDHTNRSSQQTDHGKIQTWPGH